MRRLTTGGSAGATQGEYHWHRHEDDDEFFFVLSGSFVIDLEDRSVELVSTRDRCLKGIIDRTRAPERAVILMVETAARTPTGDA